MTDSDKAKLNRAYGCVDRAHSNCGGQQEGMSGTLNGNLPMGCEWGIVAPDGFYIEIIFSSFSVIILSIDTAHIKHTSSHA